MNRRSVLRWLGLAPIAAPAAALAASKPALPPVNYSGLTASISQVRARLLHTEASISALASETAIRVAADGTLAGRIVSAEQRITASEGRTGMLVTTAAG